MATTQTEDTENHVEEPGHDIEEQTQEGPKAEEFPPLFEDEGESLSEEELIGDDTPESEEGTVPPPPEGDEEPPEKSEEESEEDAEDTPTADKKPPEGYVSLKALHEERGKRQYLASEVESLKSEISQLKDISPAEKQGDDFKILSDAEFQDLLDEDPSEAILYDRRLRVHETTLSSQAEALRTDQVIIDQSTKAMLEAVPHIYDSDSTINEDLARFAVEQGFNEQFLPALTDPRTKIIIPGSTEPVLLGEAAVGQVKMLHNLFQHTSNDEDRAAIDDEIKAAVVKDRKETTDRVTKQIMAKFKAAPSNDYQSLGDVPGSETEPFDVTKRLTSAQVDKLPAHERRAYLGG